MIKIDSDQYKSDFFLPSEENINSSGKFFITVEFFTLLP